MAKTPVKDRPSSRPELPPDAAPKPEPVNRMSFPLRDDGKPAVDRMHEKTVAQLRRLVTDPETAKLLGVVAPENDQAQAAGAAMAASVTVAVIDLVDKIGLAVALRSTHAPYAVVYPAVRLTESERQALHDPTSKVLGKWLGSVLSKWEDESALTLLLVTIYGSKIAAVRETVARTRPPAHVLQMPEPAAPKQTPPATHTSGNDAPIP